MINRLLILILCTSFNTAFGQKEKNIKLKEFKSFETPVSDIVLKNDQILYAITPPLNVSSKVKEGHYEGLEILNSTYSIVFKNGNEIHFKENEFLLFYNENKIITTCNNIKDDLTTIMIYIVGDNLLSKKKEINIPYTESYIYYLKFNESLLFSDKMEGGGHSYSIQSLTDIENQIIITPFENGYLASDEFIVDDKLFLINENAADKNEIKRTIFSLKDKKIIDEKLIRLGGYHFYKSFFNNGTILFSTYGNEVEVNKLTLFDEDMREKWSCSNPYVYNIAFFDNDLWYLPTRGKLSVINQSDGNITQFFDMNKILDFKDFPYYLSFSKNIKNNSVDFVLGDYEGSKLERIKIISINKDGELSKIKFRLNNNLDPIYAKQINGKNYIIQGKKILKYEF